MRPAGGAPLGERRVSRSATARRQNMIGFRRAGSAVLSALVVALFWVGGSTPATAQTATNSSGLEGKVSDESGAVLPGVTVTISSPSLQAPQLETTTDETGRYRFTALPRGVYTVT